MKKLILMLLLAALTLAPAVAGAQDWVMDWTSHGSSVGVLTGPYAEGWTISGTSPTRLTPLPSGMPIDFTKATDDRKAEPTSPLKLNRPDGSAAFVGLFPA